MVNLIVVFGAGVEPVLPIFNHGIGIKFSGMNAVQAQSSGSQAASPQLPAHLDFTLYAGSAKKTTGPGKSNAQ